MYGATENNILYNTRSFFLDINFIASETSQWFSYSASMKVVFTLLMMCQMSCELDAQQCRSEYSIRGMMLKGHTFMAKQTTNSLKCVEKCNHDVRCQSFNYVISQGICELNNRTKEARPEDFVPDSDRFYVKRLDGRGVVTLSVIISIILKQRHLHPMRNVLTMSLHF